MSIQASSFFAVAYKDGMGYSNTLALNFTVKQEEEQHQLTIRAGTGGYITSGEGSQYGEGETIEVSAKAYVGYEFSGWTSEGGGSFADAGSVNTRAEFAAIVSRFDQLVDGENPFSDVDSGHWGIDGVINAAARGWIKGYPDNTFGPENDITRAEAVTLTNQMFNRGIKAENIPSDAFRFTDIEKEHWAYAQIMEASTEHTYTRETDGYETWNR